MTLRSHVGAGPIEVFLHKAFLASVTFRFNFEYWIILFALIMATFIGYIFIGSKSMYVPLLLVIVLVLLLGVLKMLRAILGIRL
jgi:hypothetical protein